MKGTTLQEQKPTAFFHGRGKIWNKSKAGRMDFINLLISVLDERGYRVKWCRWSEQIEAMARADRRHLHITLNDTPLSGDNILFSVPSYLHGFWYFDTCGTRNNSSMRRRSFCPEKMSDKYAKVFAQKLREKFIEANRSKFDQPMMARFSPERGAICIFTQAFREPDYHKHYITYPELIEAVIANRGGRRVYIKPHPNQSLWETARLMGYHNPDAGVEVINHSIHDLLAHAAVAVSLSSAVLLEAQMHRVPGVVGGDVDFHHNMVSVRHPEEIGPALEKALTARFAYEKYLVFFFAQGMIQPHLKKKAVERIGAILTETGFGGVP